ncbi:MAG TPA: GNAT family N-acetyltransferase [Panacibacter sp.]|nr:GNAT family N-acetyltransferase [Panacibacter sp.]
MTTISYRQATNQDVPFLAKIRSENQETENHWNDRISAYLNYTHNPQQALKTRIIYVALHNNIIIGFVAGHLTTRYECQGELQWINVVEKYRQTGIASNLVQILAIWFIGQKSYKVCVDPGNDIARQFYKKNGAENLNSHWMFWEDIRNIII